MCRFNPSKILLSLFDVSNAFHDSIWVIYTVVSHIFVFMLVGKHFWNVK